MTSFVDMLPPSVVIVMVSMLSAIAAEGISWVLIYRTDDYKQLKKTIDNLTKKLDKKKDSVPIITKQKSKDKKVNHLDTQLKTKNKAMAMVKFKSMVFVALTLLGVYTFLSNLFDGTVVARLPFTPLPLIRGMSHRNLPGNDFTDCSMVFVYVLCSLSIRNNVQRFFGFAPPQTGPSLMSPPGSQF